MQHPCVVQPEAGCEQGLEQWLRDKVAPKLEELLAWAYPLRKVFRGIDFLGEPSSGASAVPGQTDSVGKSMVGAGWPENAPGSDLPLSAKAQNCSRHGDCASEAGSASAVLSAVSGSMGRLMACMTCMHSMAENAGAVPSLMLYRVTASCHSTRSRTAMHMLNLCCMGQW